MVNWFLSGGAGVEEVGGVGVVGVVRACANWDCMKPVRVLEQRQ